MKRKLFLLSLSLSLILATQAFGQGHTVKGKVQSSDDRAPMLAVNIVVKGTNMGTATDNDGMYELKNVSAQGTLVFLFIGYQRQEIPINGRATINVTMTPEAIAGEELVVTGYGTQVRRNLTVAISSLDEHSFTQSGSIEPQTLLQARIPGVVVSQPNGEPGGSPVIRIRGGTSVAASNQPLIVIDGVPIDNTSPTPGGDTGTLTGGNTDNVLSTLNASDIASIDILKDASAAAIYGARGGNGVILITTKQGRPGGFSLTYDGYTSASTLTKKLDLLTAQEYRDFAAQLGANPPSGTTDTDWQDAITRTGISQTHNLAFSSGSANTQYRVSLNYAEEQGIVIGSDRQRISGRLNLNHKMLDDKLSLVLRLNPSFIKRNNTPYLQDAGFEGGVFTNVFKMNPTDPVYKPDGSYFVFEQSPVSIRNPLALAELVDDVQSDQRIFVNSTAEYEFFSGLSGKVNLGFDRSAVSRKVYQPNSIPYSAAFGGRADVRENEQRTTTFETTMNYRKNVSSSQQLEVWGGYTFQEFELSGFGAAAKSFVTDAFTFNNLGGGADFTERPYSFANKSRLISFLGRANYSMANGKYLFQAAVRHEGSSRFGEGKKWGTFPAASIGWRLSEESFMQNLQSVNDLKLRLSYGVTGNQDIGNYKSLVLLGPGANAVIGGQTLTGVSATQLANPDLQWEETSQLNLGIDFGLLNDRLSGSIDLYNKKTTNLLLEFAVPQPAVVSTRLDNAGEVKNRGIEVALSTINVSSGGFFWRTDFNFASNKNEVVSLGSRDFIVHSRVSGAGLSDLDALIILPGHPLGTFFGPRFLGYDSDGNEILSTNPDRPESSTGPRGDGRQILGDAQPDFTFGFTNSMNYKNFDFRFFVQGVLGVDILNNTRLEYQRPSNVFNGINLFRGAIEDVANGLGANATVAYSDRFIENGSYVRLQNVTLGYTFGAGFLTQQIRSLRLYVSADNPFVITGYKGYDPEVNTFVANAGTGEGVGSVPSIGIDYTNYPRARTFSFGINLGL